MIEDLCFHIVDLVQNSVSAGAREIRVRIDVSLAEDRIQLEIDDDGRGMDAETRERVQDPFYTTKAGKKVGLGIPLMKETALQCDGDFSIRSDPGKGTVIRATYRLSHIDTPPLGPVADTIMQLVVATPGVNMVFRYSTDAGRFDVSTAMIREQVGEMPLTHPEVLGFLRSYIGENVSALAISMEIRGFGKAVKKG